MATAKHTIKLVPHILHTMVYRDGELLAILPPNAKEQWGRVSALVVFDLIENDQIEMFGEIIP